jgi:hypothetical protein
VQVGYGVQSSGERLRVYGATEAECRYLVTGQNRDTGRWEGQRVELNKMSAAMLLGLIRQKFDKLGVKKVTPPAGVLDTAYERMARTVRVEGEARRIAERVNVEPVAIPDGLTDWVVRYMTEHREASYDEALYQLARSRVGTA